MGLKYPPTDWGMDVKIKLVRLGMTQNELADKVGVPYYKISRLVRGVYKDDELVDRVNEVLGKAS